MSLSNKNNSQRVSDFLLDLAKLTTRKQKSLYSCQICIAGRIIICYFTEKNMTNHFPEVLGDGGVPSVAASSWNYYCIKDTTGRYMELFGQNSYRCRDDTGILFVRTGWVIYAVDRIHKTLFTYYTSNFEPMIQQYGIRPALMFHWARAEDMLFLHGAAFGLNGSGVMISEFGGKGKSTLAVSSLMSGLQVISDDYLLVDRKNYAMPIYRFVKLMPDSYQWISSIYPEISKFKITFKDEKQGGKLLLSAVEQPFADQLLLKALIRPVVTDEEAPMILSEDRGKVLTRMIRSTITQMGLTHDTDVVKSISQQFLTIPTYEFRLCNDLQKNMEVLCEYILKL